MNRIRTTAVVLALSMIASLWLTGCRQPMAMEPESAADQPSVARATPIVMGDKVKVGIAVPTGDKASSVIYVEKVAPKEVRVGQPFEYHIMVTNLTDCELEDVSVSDRLPPHFQYQQSNPTAKDVSPDEAQWLIGSLGAYGSSTITVTGTALGTGTLTQCSKVVYRTPLCLTVVAVEPKLDLTKSAPKEVLLCDPIPVRFVVTNAGTGTAHNVTISEALPPGLVTMDGETMVEFDAGSLGMGESREFTLNLKALRTGTYVNEANARADGGLTASADATTIVRQPILAISKTAPERLFIGRNVDYRITVRNEGDAPAAETVIQDAVPSGTRFVKASDGGKPMEGMVSWQLGVLPQGESRTVALTLHADTIQTIRNTASASAVCATAVTSTAVTELVGIPAVSYTHLRAHET